MYMKRRITSTHALLIGIVSAVAMFGCGGGGGGSNSGGGTNGTTTAPVEGYVTSAEAIDGASNPFPATVVSGSIPSNGTGPALTLTNDSNNLSGVLGGSVLVTLTSQSPVSALDIGVNGIAGYYSINLVNAAPAVRSAGKTASDYWVTDTASNFHVHVRHHAHAANVGATDYILSLSLPGQLQVSSMALTVVGQYSTGQGSAAVSPGAVVNMNIIPAQTSSSSFQASLTWRAPVDIDLHCTPPGGSEIGFNNRSSVGGSLNVDSNPGCSIDNIDQENITWGAGTAPVGVYRIRPDYYSACQTGTIPFQLTINTPQTGSTPARYVDSFDESDQDGNSNPSDDVFAIYCCVLPPKSTDAGLLATLILAEVGNPSGGFSPQASNSGAQAIRAVVENRKVAPNRFSAPNATTSGIIFANGGQFAGFFQNGTIDPAVLSRVRGDLFPNINQQPAVTWVPFWNNVITASTEAYSKSANDPFANVKSVDGDTTIGGSYGVRTAGSSSPGGNFRLAGTAAGQDFYTLVPGVVPAN